MSLLLGTPTFEPLGFKKPPDFGFARQLGVEVRRLNQNHFEGGNASGLEEASIPLDRTFKKVLESYDSSFDGLTFWVSIIFKRPLPSSKVLSRDMRNALDEYLKESQGTPRRLKVNDEVDFDIRPSQKVVPSRVFRRAITSDADSGGFVVQMYIDNIRHCIGEKKSKIAPVKHEFKEWWLILVDTMMAWDLEVEEVDEIRSGIRDCGGFTQIIILDYTGDKCLLTMQP